MYNFVSQNKYCAFYAGSNRNILVKATNIHRLNLEKPCDDSKKIYFDLYLFFWNSGWGPS
jgi:hypothetical protein